MGKIIIFGGAGFIGNYLTKKLAQNPLDSIDVIDNFSRAVEQGSDIISAENVNYISMDIANNFEPDKLSNAYDEVYILASVVGVDYVLNNPTFVLTENMKIISNLFSWLQHVAVSRVLYTSTSEVYAGAVQSGIANLPTNEDVPVMIEEIGHPRFTYAITKAYAEALFINAANETSFESIVVRYHNVYGNKMGNRHVLPHLVKRFGEENPFTIYGCDQTRSFNHVDDAVNGTIIAMRNGASGNIYHVGTDVEVTIEQLTRYVGSLLGYEGDYQYADPYPGSVKRRMPDISKLRALGYEPLIDWKAGVAEYVRNEKSLM